MRLIDADNVLNGIEELKKSPWFNRGKEIVKSDPGFQHIGYLERKEAVETVRDLCIRQEPTVGGCISVKDRLPEDETAVIAYVQHKIGWYRMFAWHDMYGWHSSAPEFDKKESDYITHWMPLPEPPEERDENDATDRR